VARVEMPVYEGIDVKDVLYSKNTISAIETVFTIHLEKDDFGMKGDGFLSISKNGDLNLRVYSLGLLVLEVISEKGIIQSNPLLDIGKGKLLANGLRDCFFWWDIADSDIDEKKDMYLFKNQSRMLWINKKTILPIKQTICIDDGTELTIHYESPRKTGDIWYPSKIRMELPKYYVILKIKEYHSFHLSEPNQQRQTLLSNRLRHSA